jgi:O-antigen/teichoic acid export membrane protein
MADSAIWVVLMRFLIRTLGVVSTIVLARLLTPADYGLIALATVLAAAVELFSSFNFEIWLLRHPNPEREHFNTVWTLSVIRGCITALLLWSVADPMANFYEDLRLADVIRVLAIGVLLSSFANVGVIHFQRDLKFEWDVLFNVSVKLGAFIVTITLGVLWRNYWALATGIVAGHLLRLIVSYGIHPYRPRPSLYCWRDAFNFSQWLLLGNFLSFVCRRSDTFMLGKLAGGEVLGLYNVAREIADLAATEIVMPIRRVMVPGYAKLQHDLAEIRRAFIDGFGVIMLIGVPCALGLAVVADSLIRVMLGPQWINAIPIMQVLGLNGVAVIGLANQWPTLIALGRPELASVVLAVCAVILLPSLYFGSSYYGAVGAALALGAVNTLLFILGLIMIQRLTRYTWSALWRSVSRTMIAAMAMALVVAGLQAELIARGVPAIMTLVACVVAGVTVYVAALFVQVIAAGMKAGPERQVLGFVRRKLRSIARH